MANPRIEEVEDSSDEDINIDDPDEMDLDAFDFARPKGTLGQTALTPQNIPAAAQAIPSTPSQPQQAPQQMSAAEHERLAREHREKSKHYQCIYPVYFDSSRSREAGRRVKKEEAVANPLAREIVEALHHIGNSLGVPLQIVFEPAKCHPKDWANPGRVKVLVKQDGAAVHKKITNKHYLLKLISAYLLSHPTTPEAPMKLRISGLPMPKEAPPPPAIPRGFKMGEILPLHSPALSGGGVSENFFKDMMEEMGGQLPQGMEGMANMAGMGAGGGGGGPKKIRIKQRR